MDSMGTVFQHCEHGSPDLANKLLFPISMDTLYKIWLSLLKQFQGRSSYNFRENVNQRTNGPDIAHLRFCL